MRSRTLIAPALLLLMVAAAPPALGHVRTPAVLAPEAPPPAPPNSLPLTAAPEAAAPAGPGPERPPAPPAHEAGAGALGLLAAAAGLGLLSAALRRPRAVLATALLLALSVFTFEAGIHSVHHLPEPGDARDCPVAWTAAHGAATEPEAAPAVAAPGLSRGVLPALAAGPLLDPACPPQQGRAPPAASRSL